MHDATYFETYQGWCWESGQSPLNLVCRTLELPVLLPGEVLVRNHVAGLNPVDWKALGGRLTPWAPGHVPGVDGAGIVVAVGPEDDTGHEPGALPEGRTKWLGRRVAYHQSLTRPGSFATYTPVHRRALMALPQMLDFETAASMPCPALTAWQALTKLPDPVRSHPYGAALLIAGAGGGVGHYLAQIALSRGFEVTALCHPRHWARLQALGVRHCMADPLPRTGAHEANTSEALVMDPLAALKNRFFAVIDCVGAEHAAALSPVVKANGHVICIQNRLTDWPDAPFTRCVSMHEIALGALHHYGDDADWHALTMAGERLLHGLAAQNLLPEQVVIRDFAALPAFLHELEHRQFSGKALIRLAPG